MIDSLPREVTVFVDRNSGGRIFKAAVQAANIKIVLHDEHFPPTEKPPQDHEWLTIIGKLGWLIVTGDTRTIKEPLFLQNIPESEAFVFLLHDLNGQNPSGKAQCLIDAYPKMIGLVQTADKPSVWIMKCGTIRLFDWRSHLAQMAKRMADVAKFKKPKS